MEIYEKEAQNLLRKLGANGSYIGFWYAAYGIVLTIKDPELLVYISKGLYVDISFKFNTTTKCVERNIRTIKNIIWEYGNRDLLNFIFTYELKEVPSNAYFIDALANYIVSTYKYNNDKWEMLNKNISEL